MKEFVKMRGHFTLKKAGEESSLVDLDNLVMTVGKEWAMARLEDASPPARATHIALGTDNTAAAIGQTALLAEIGREAISSRNKTGAVVELSAVFGPGSATGALVEAGLLNDDTTGTLIARVVFTPVNKGADDTYTGTWRMEVI